VIIDPKFDRPAEVDALLGKPAKAKTKPGWKPTTDHKTFVTTAVDADTARGEGIGSMRYFAPRNLSPNGLRT